MKNLQYLKNKIVIAIFLMIQLNANSDWQHYNNFLIGDRATGMGGAYTALSDDPSGIFYNPGGLAFCGDSEISLSTIGYYTNTLKVNSLLGVSDFQLKQNDADMINGFFGGVTKLQLFSKDFYLSFGIFVPDNSNINSKIRLSSSNNGVIYAGDQRITDSQSNYSLGISTKLFDNLGLGFTVGFLNIDHSELLTKNITYGPFLNSLQNYVYAVNTNTSDKTLNLKEFDVSLGTLYKIIPELSIGFTLIYKIPIYQYFSSSSLDSAIVVDSNFIPVEGTVTLDDGTIFTQHVNTYSSYRSSSIFNKLPTQFRFGVAWNPNAYQTLSSDIVYYSGIQTSVPSYNLKPIFNLSFGSETIFFEQLKLRLGIFTNNWAGNATESEHVINSDFLGFSTGLAYSKNQKTSYGLTVVYQQTFKALYVPDTSISKSNYPNVDWSTLILSLGMSSEL